jgi:hypothetical protein
MKIRFLLILACLLTGYKVSAQISLDREHSSYRADSTRFDAHYMRFSTDLEYSTMYTTRYYRAVPAIVNPKFDFQAGNCQFETLSFHMLEHGRIELDQVICNNDFFVQSATDLELQFSNSRFKQEIYTPNCRIKALNLYQDTVNVLDITRVDMAQVFLSNCLINAHAELGGVLRDTLKLYNNRFEKGARLDLTGLKGDSLGQRTIPIILTAQDIEQIDFDYQKFRLVFDNSTPKDSCIKVYERLIASFRHKNQLISAKRLSRELRYFANNDTFNGRVLNFLTDQYEDYGQNLPIMLGFTFFMLLFFATINLCLYKKLNAEVYEVKNFQPGLPRRQPRRFFRHYYYSMVYTAILFINPLVKLENLKYKKPRLLYWVLFIYLTGLILLYYILHYLIQLK